MKKIFTFNWCSLFLISMLLGLVSCKSASENAGLTQGGPAGAAGGLQVLAVESFLADIAQNVAGGRLQVDTLMPMGIDPHAYEPTPKDVARISDSDVLIINGAGIEEWLSEVIDNAGGERMVIETSAGLASRTALEDEQAVMSPEEKAEAFCAALAETEPIERQTLPDLETAVRTYQAGEQPDQETENHEQLHELSYLQLGLLTGQASQYGGFLPIHVDQSGDFQVAVPEGNLTLRSFDLDQELEPEDTYAVDCGGFAKILVFELDAGEYILDFSGFASNTISFASGAAGGQHHDGDPHFWMDPVLVVRYVENIRDGFIQADPQGEDVYTRNASEYITRLNELDQLIKQQVATVPEERRLIVTNHESFGYFADRYGFKVIGTIIPGVSSGASPSAQQLAYLIDHIKETGATAIFLETGANPQLANQVAKETGVNVVTDLYTHSITEPGGNAPSYIDMMKYNVEVIVNALK